MKKLKSILVLFFLACVIVLVVVAIVHNLNVTCNTLEVRVETISGKSPLTEKMAQQLIINSEANPIGGKVRKANATAMENALKQNPWFNKITATTVKGSRLLVTISAKCPIALLCHPDSDPLLLADNGQLLPDDTLINYLPVINGSITKLSPFFSVKKSKQTGLKNAYSTALFLCKNQDYAAQYPQIFVRPDGLIELYSIYGDQPVLIGNADNLSTKLANVDIAYKNGILTTGNYKALDARFNNRIYAIKSQTN